MLYQCFYDTIQELGWPTYHKIENGDNHVTPSNEAICGHRGRYEPSCSFHRCNGATPQPPEVTIYPVSFPSGSIVLHTADYETIHGIAAMMARDPALVAVVLGKADTMGPASYNERLSQRRAEVVSDALVRIYKVPADRVAVRWAGESQPVVATADQTAELQNRVAEIIVR